MNGRGSRDKSACTEHAVVRLLQAQGQLTQGSPAWCPGSSFNVPTPSINRAVEVKCRAAGFRQLYDWLNQRDVLIVKADQQEPLVVLRMSLAAQIAKKGTA